jgi:hypothetical protein
MRGLRLIAGLWALGFLGTSVALAQDYEIKLTRPTKVGAEYHVAVVGHDSMKSTVKVDGKVVEEQSKNFSVDFESDVKALEVDKNGEPSKVSLTVDKCILKQGGAEKPLLAKGAVVIASVKDDETVFEIAGQPVDAETAEALGLVVALGRNRASDDEVFGTKERKKVGDHWAMNAELAAKELQDVMKGSTVKKEDVAGTVTLDKVVKVGTTDCLQISVEMTVNNETIPGMEVSQMKIQVHFSGLFPIDLSKDIMEESDSMTMSMTGKGKPNPDGPEMVIESVAERSLNVKTTHPN